MPPPPEMLSSIVSIPPLGSPPKGVPTYAAGSGLSYRQSRPGAQRFVSPDGAAHVGFRPAHGFALVLGPPVGPSTAWASLVSAFERHCRALGLAPAFCGVGVAARSLLVGRGYRSVKVGDEAVVDLETLDLAGRRWRECRAAVNRGRRRGVTFAWVPPERRRGRLLDELREVSREWLARRPLPEIGVVIGTNRDLCAPDALLAAARGADGRVLGFVTWTPVPGGVGWMLDLMRGRAGAMAGLMDLLITRSLLDMKRAGYPTASLGGTPFSNVGNERGGVLRWVLDLVFRRVRVGYRFRPLWRFKGKFNPRWEPLYLAVGPGASPLRACWALVRASLADVGRRHLVRAVLNR